VQIRGNERLGWDQPAADAAALAALRFIAYIDNAGVDMQDTSCGPSTAATAFSCSGRLPSMAPGLHTIELSAYFEFEGRRIEGARSAPLRVRLVTGVTSSQSAGDASSFVTVDGAELRTTTLATGLEDPTDLAVTRDGRVLVAERGGRIRVFRAGALLDQPALTIDDVVTGEGRGLLGVALGPRFDETGEIYTVYTSDRGFVLARFLASDGGFGGRAVLLDGVNGSSSDPRALVRTGPDGRLYLGLDDGQDAVSAGDLGSFNGKILRLNRDGTTPSDQEIGTPVYALDINRPTGLDWDDDGLTLWVTEVDPDGADRLQMVSSDRIRRRGVTRARYTLPPDTGASGIAFYRSEAIPAFRDNLFVAASDAAALLRIRFDESGSIAGTEWLLRNQLGPMKGIAVAPDGAIYLCTSDALVRVTLDR
jgi:glucose/arabinose dehydrogenase